MPDETATQGASDAEADEDDFGGFGAAEKASENGKHHENEEEEPNIDSGFGDLTSSQSNEQQEGEAAENDIEEALAPTESAEIPDQDNLGDFGSPPAPKSDLVAEEVGDPIDDNMAAGCADTSSQEDKTTANDILSTVENDEGKKDGHTGETSDAADNVSPLHETSSAPHVSSTTDSDLNGDDFGDFGSAEPAAVSTTEAVSENLTTEDNENEMDNIDVEGTPETTNEAGQPKIDDGDAFGGFGSAEVTLETPNEQNEQGEPAADDEDDFGGFGSAEVSPEPTNEQTEQVKSKPDDDGDAFGGFGSAEVTPETPNEQNEQGEPAADDEDAFGGFGSAEVSPEPTNEQTEQVKSKPDDDEDDFGGFDSADVPPETTNEQGQSQDEGEDAFRGFDSAEVSPAPTNEQTEQVKSKPDDDEDDFGGFGSADVPPESTNEQSDSKGGKDEYVGDFGSVEAPPEAPNENIEEKVDDEDDFGGFESTEVAPETTNKQSEPMAVSDDDFGDFGSAEAPPETSKENSETKAEDEDVSAPPETTNDTHATNAAGDDFGDFGSATPGSSPVPPHDSSGFGGYDDAKDGEFGDFDGPTTAGSSPVDGDGGDDDDFGDFGSAAKAEPAEIESKMTDDSFGDFNDAPSEAAKAAGDDDFGDVNTGPGIESKVTEDSFGDFNDVPSDSGKAAGGDDFGDFDSAPASEAVAPPTLADDGDFGDFSSFNESSPGPAQTKAPVSSNSGFSANFGAQSQPAPPVEENDPVLQKARTVFSRVFQGFPSDESDDENGSGSDAVAVEGLMSSVRKEQGGEVNEKPMENLLSILKGIEQEASPSVYIISEGESYCPNAHFSVNLGGESAPEADNMLIRQYESHPEFQPSTPSRSDQPSRPSNVSKPPSSASTAASKQGDSTEGEKSEKCRSLLQQIPDLSFMLQSKLSLPSNSK